MEKSTDVYESYFHGIGRSEGVSSTESFSKVKVDYFSRDAVFLCLKKNHLRIFLQTHGRDKLNELNENLKLNL